MSDTRPKQVTEVRAPAGPDDLAVAESQAFASGDLETESKRREHGRHEKLLDLLSFVFQLFISLAALLLSAALLAWAWHFLTPICWSWLTPQQLEKLQTVLFSSLLAGVVSRYLGRYF